jgi:hypothetical protein
MRPKFAKVGDIGDATIGNVQQEREAQLMLASAPLER